MEHKRAQYQMLGNGLATATLHQRSQTYRGGCVSTFSEAWKTNVVGLGQILGSDAWQWDLRFYQHKGHWWGSTDFSM
jgi:hypothetical protein